MGAGAEGQSRMWVSKGNKKPRTGFQQRPLRAPIPSTHTTDFSSLPIGRYQVSGDLQESYFPLRCHWRLRFHSVTHPGNRKVLSVPHQGKGDLMTELWAFTEIVFLNTGCNPKGEKLGKGTVETHQSLFNSSFVFLFINQHMT